MIFKEYQIMGNTPLNQMTTNGGELLHNRYETEKMQQGKQFEEGIRWFVWKTIVNLVIHFNLKRTDPSVKQQLRLAVDAASASGDVKRIARYFGIDWNEIVDKQIEMTLIMKNSSHISFYNSDCGDSIETIKFLEDFEKDLQSRL